MQFEENMYSICSNNHSSMQSKRKSILFSNASQFVCSFQNPLENSRQYRPHPAMPLQMSQSVQCLPPRWGSDGFPCLKVRNRLRFEFQQLFGFSMSFFHVKNQRKDIKLNLGEQLLLVTLFVCYYLWRTLFTKIGPNFWRLRA